MRAGKHEEALRAFGRSVKRWHDMQIWHQQWTTLRSLVQLLRQMGAHEEATTLLGGLISADADAYGSDANSMSEAAAALEEALGLDRFTMATRRGTAMSAEATVAFALAAVDSLLTGADCATTCRN